MKKTRIVAIAAAVVVLLAAGGGAWWWQSRSAAPAGEPAPRQDVDYRYVTLDKTIVMLRGGSDGAAHYLALDLVFKTPAKTERQTKDQLPLLRTVVVKAMSAHTLDSAKALTIEQFAGEINAAIAKSYADERAEQPFAEALIAKLIIE